MDYVIRGLLRDAEKRHGYVLKPDEFESCARYQVARITRQVDRWVTGAKSHPDERWRDVNFLRNTIQELDDALNYIDGHLEFNTKPRRI